MKQMPSREAAEKAALSLASPYPPVSGKKPVVQEGARPQSRPWEKGTLSAIAPEEVHSHCSRVRFPGQEGN